MCIRDRKAVMQNWMRRSQQTLEQWFAPDTARGLDAFIEGMTLHLSLIHIYH